MARASLEYGSGLDIEDVNKRLIPAWRLLEQRSSTAHSHTEILWQERGGQYRESSGGSAMRKRWGSQGKDRAGAQTEAWMLRGGSLRNPGRQSQPLPDSATLVSLPTSASGVGCVVIWSFSTPRHNCGHQAAHIAHGHTPDHRASRRHIWSHQAG